MEANRKELAIFRGKRTPETLGSWAQVFGEGDRKQAERYALAVATFIGTHQDGEWSDYLGQLSPNTKKAYAFAVAEFFEWCAVVHNKAVPPHKVTRKDAEDYISWLANRNFSLAEEKLKDGDMEDKRALFAIVKKLGKANLQQVITNLPDPLFAKYFGDIVRDRSDETDMTEVRHSRRQVSTIVRSMVTMDILSASPTLAQLRKDYPSAGISQHEIEGIPMEDVFTYVVKVYAPVSKTTVALRIAALSMFWKTLMQGENVAGGEAILRYDIWDGVKKRVNRGIAPTKKEAARQQKVPKEAVLRMLEHAPVAKLTDIRNKAILYLMVFSGLRTTELLKLRRGQSKSHHKMPYFDGSEPPALQILRKGNKWMRIPYPPVALKPLIEFQSELDKRAVSTYAQFDDEAHPDYVPFGNIGYYYRDLQLPDAPLFPSISMWGNNIKDDYRRSMSRTNLYKLLQSIAEGAGLSEELVKQVHPHAIRHFSANAMVAGGKDLREVQHILGHTSITTTEGYLEDVEDEVKLSGQSEILDYLKIQGVDVQPTYDGKEHPERETKPGRVGPEVIDTYAIEVEGPQVKVVQPISDEEVQIISELTENLPQHDLPLLPAYVSPETSVIDTADGEVLVEGESQGLIGLADGNEEHSQDMLDNIITTLVRGVSPSSPDWVYEALADQTDYEPVVFQRGGQKDIAFLQDNYPKMPKNFGLGKDSLLPWYVKAKGNISAAGFFKGAPPFPVWAPDQVTPETVRGKQFLDAVEALYVESMHGDADKGIAPSPIKSVGLIQWFGFFAYNAQIFAQSFEHFFSEDTPDWGEFSEPVKLRDLRMHKTEWLIAWLRENAHTYRASVDAMKRGVPRGEPRGSEKTALRKKEQERDPEEYFLRASFEGIDLVEQVPEWMVEEDPVHALYLSDPKEYGEMIQWLRNVTGQALTRDRKDERAEQQTQEEDALRKKAERVRDVLKGVYEERDKLASAKAKGLGADSIVAVRKQFRQLLIAYMLIASENETLLTAADMEILQTQPTRAFAASIAQHCADLGIPDINGDKYKRIKGVKNRISVIVKELFPETDLLENANIFADSDLFDPRWFRISDIEHTVYLESGAGEELQAKYGVKQNPLLLVRRAARAMYEAREKGYDKLWGVMMSYFSWILPTGSEMEKMVTGIPIKSTGVREIDKAARVEWLRDWQNNVRELAGGQKIKQALKDTKPGQSAELDALIAEQFSEDTGNEFYGDAMDHAVEAVEYVSSVGASHWEDAEALDLLLAQEAGEYSPNVRAGLTPNGKSTYLHMTGEKPKGWYKIDLYGRREGFKKNAAPVTYMSPGVLYNSQKKIDPARKLLPSPFRMIAAMRLE